jgi:hypothetical protein
LGAWEQMVNPWRPRRIGLRRRVRHAPVGLKREAATIALECPEAVGALVLSPRSGHDLFGTPDQGVFWIPKCGRGQPEDAWHMNMKSDAPGSSSGFAHRLVALVASARVTKCDRSAPFTQTMVSSSLAGSEWSQSGTSNGSVHAERTRLAGPKRHSTPPAYRYSW